MKRTIRMLFLVVMTSIIICGCAHASNANPVLTGNGSSTSKELVFDADGNYAGFANIPSDYTLQDALKDGCLVISGKTENDRSRLFGGGDAWQTFITQSAKGQNAFLRVVHFLEKGAYYQDLHYIGGKYHLFETNPEQIKLADRPYRFLRALDGEDGMPRKPVTMFVLTDSLELTCHDVLWSFYSSNLNSITKIPFVWLGFTTYLPDQVNDQNICRCSIDEMIALVESMTGPTQDKPLLMISSNPSDYIKAHQKTYDRLVACGQDAVDCFTKILRDAESFGLTKYLMAAICAEITGVGQDGGWSSADEWIKLYDQTTNPSEVK